VHNGAQGATWIVSRKKIIHNYLTTWFFLDALSIAVSAFDLIALGSDGSTSGLKALRVVRALRLIKLVRLLRASRIFRRWESEVSINYTLLDTCACSVGVILVSHWFACLWGMQAAFKSSPVDSWMGEYGYCAALVNSTCPEGWSCDRDLEWGCMDAGLRYVASLYWSVMTITSIGA
jgi:hypothetical protein